MRVGVIATEIGRAVGGRFVFQDMLLDAAESPRPEARHSFHLYSAGISRFTERGRAWKARRLVSVGGTLATQASRNLQDSLGRRLLDVRSGLQRRLDEDKIDLVWFPTIYIEEVGRPFICTVFDLEHRIKPWFPEVSAQGEFERRERLLHRFLPKATRVIVPSTVGREQAVRFYGLSEENFLILPHPTPPLALAAGPGDDSVATQRAHHLGVRRPYLLYPAQFWPHKNHAATLDVLQVLERRGESFDLALVGSDVGLREHVHAQVVERGLGHRVHFLGFVEDADLIELYRGAHALLYLSRFGPENLPPLEAFATGCPAVVADVPGAAEQFGSAALIVDSLNPDAVAEAVVTVGRPEVRARLVAAGLKRARAWTADDYVDGVIRFLDAFERERRLWP